MPRSNCGHCGKRLDQQKNQATVSHLKQYGEPCFGASLKGDIVCRDGCYDRLRIYAVCGLQFHEVSVLISTLSPGQVSLTPNFAFRQVKDAKTGKSVLRTTDGRSMDRVRRDIREAGLTMDVPVSASADTKSSSSSSKADSDSEQFEALSLLISVRFPSAELVRVEHQGQMWIGPLQPVFKGLFNDSVSVSNALRAASNAASTTKSNRLYLDMNSGKVSAELQPSKSVQGLLLTSDLAVLIQANSQHLDDALLDLLFTEAGGNPKVAVVNPSLRAVTIKEAHASRLLRSVQLVSNRCAEHRDRLTTAFQTAADTAKTVRSIDLQVPEVNRAAGSMLFHTGANLLKPQLQQKIGEEKKALCKGE
jgi:hypothetical protein